MNDLVNIQNELKAPKGQYNNFGKYKYRNAEDILEAVKPILLKYKCTLFVSDEVIQVADRIYIKANCNFTDSEGKVVQVSAMARESESKKGMDSSQVTGAASSYARKYALNGLFLIDDTKDADSMKPEAPQQKQKPVLAPTNKKLWANAVNAMIAKGSTIEQIRQKCIISDENFEILKEQAIEEFSNEQK